MKFCITCGAQLEDDSVFCTSCGAQQQTQQPVVNNQEYNPQGYNGQVYNGQVYNQQIAEQTYVKPAQDGGSKAKGIVGFVLGLVGMVMQIISISLGASALDTWSYSEAEELASAGISLGIVFLAASIVGVIMSFKGKGGMAIVGRVFSFVGIGLFAIAFIMCISAIA